MSCVAVLFSTIGLYVGMMKDVAPKTEEYLLQLGQETCTYPASNHFYWLFKVDALGGFRPHWFTFLSLLTIPQLFRKNNDNHWWGPGWVVAFMQIAGFLFGGWYFGDTSIPGGDKAISAIFTHPIASGWCAFSVPSGIFFPCFGKIYNNFFNPNFKKSGAAVASKKKK